MGKSSSRFIGVYYNKQQDRWRALRWNKNEKALFYNGIYKDEETAAQASDTLARILNGNGSQNHKLNFPDDLRSVYQQKMKSSSNFIGVSLRKNCARWMAFRRSKHEKKVFYGANYK